MDFTESSLAKILGLNPQTGGKKRKSSTRKKTRKAKGKKAKKGKKSRKSRK
jgi:hypothetical protein